MNNGKYHTPSFISKQSAKTDRIFGSIVDHYKICEECNEVFTWIGREHTKEYKKRRFCSRKCANKQGPKNRQYDYHYRTLCWKYHKKECVICRENLIVEVHHYDENHSNNHPTNFVPLCPTHHSYIKHKQGYYIIKDRVNEYHNQFKNQWKNGGHSLTG